MGRTDTAITIERVSIRYGDAPPVVRDVSLVVAAGSTTVLLGPSGCGKTTLLRAIAGLETPSAGRIMLGDRTVSGPGEWVAPERRQVGMVFQDPSLFPHLTVAENVAFGLRRTGDRTSRDLRVAEMLELVGLAEMAGRKPGTLSGGQQQRVALARSLAPSPAVLLLDEPFSALDAMLRTQLRTDVAAIVREVGVTTVFVTHDQDEAFVMGDTIAVMHDGVLRQVASPEQLYRCPADPWVADFVGESNIVAGVATGDTAATVVGTVRLDGSVPPPSGDVDVLVRPEHLTAVAGGTQAVIASVEFYGHDARYEVRLPTGEVVVVREQGDQRHVAGDPVDLHWVGSSARWWPAQTDRR
ncbi:MAG: ABC transporter ATP-binding protein [Ilumatobacteraceae bacterium]